MRHATKCHVDPVEHRASSTEKNDAEITRLGLAGLGCPNCANRVRNSLLGVSGVAH